MLKEEKRRIRSLVNGWEVKGENLKNYSSFCKTGLRRIIFRYVSLKFSEDKNGDKLNEFALKTQAFRVRRTASRWTAIILISYSR